MPSWWFLRAKPSEEPTPDDGYDAFFSGDGTEGTTAGTLYRKDFNGVVTPVGTGGGGGGGTYTDEQAQDAVGRILTDTTTVDFTYNDGANTITAAVVAGSIGTTQLAANAVTNAVLADMPGATVKGRPAGAAGDPQDLNATALKALMSFTSTDITDFTEAAQDAVGAALTDTASVHLAYNDVANTVTGQVQADGITTAMIAPNAVGSLQLGANVVTNDNLAQMPAKTFKANKTTALAPAADVTVPDVKAMLVYAATEIVSAPFGTVTATNVQAALEELYALIQGLGGAGGSTLNGTYDVINYYNSVHTAAGDYLVAPGPYLTQAADAVQDVDDTTYINGLFATASLDPAALNHRVGVTIGPINALSAPHGPVVSITFTVRCSNSEDSQILVASELNPSFPSAPGIYHAGQGLTGGAYGNYTGTGVQDIVVGPFTPYPTYGNVNWLAGAMANNWFDIQMNSFGNSAGTVTSQPRIHKVTVTVRYPS